MKNFKRIFIAIMAILAISTTASAQFRWGIKAGVNVNSFSFDKETFDASNRTGFTGGLTTEFTVPLVGIGFDASLMYVHRYASIDSETAGQSGISAKSDYIELPINLKYKFGIPALGKVLTPYLYTGPSFAVRCSKEAVAEGWNQKKFDASWNLGVGIQLVNHLQVSANYGWGMTKAFEHVTGSQTVDLGRANGWTITAAWLF